MKGIISRQRPDSTQQQRGTGKEPFRALRIFGAY